ncbi:MAG: hypothetical protein M1822_003106 [Bathelium mastoideum]|nr:MAG: hypothetical protein M1822_003106 [Bathelium mastoideum]
MATVLPPPSKRQKLAAEAKARAEEEERNNIPTNLGRVRVRFHDHASGEPTGPAVYIELKDATVKNLEILANNLDGHESASDRIPYNFFYQPPKTDSEEGSPQILIKDGLYQSMLQSDRQSLISSTEPEITIKRAPQAVFRVKAVTRCSGTIPGHGSTILCMQFPPENSSRLLTGSGDATARIWDCDTGTPVTTLKGHTDWIFAVSWSPDSEIIATGSKDKTVRLWDKHGKSLGGPLTGHTKAVRNLSWEPYHAQQPGRPRLASCSQDGTVRIWDVVGRRIDMVLSGHSASVTCVKWGGLGQIYTASQDKTIKVWNADKGTLIDTLKSHAHWVNHLALSTDFALRLAFRDSQSGGPKEDGKRRAAAKYNFEKAARIGDKLVERLASASDDCTMYLWEPLSTTKPLGRMVGHQKVVNHVMFSPNGLYIASAGFDNHVKMWSATDGRFVRTLRGHVGAVYQCCFSADSRLLVSSSKDTTVKVWNVESGKLVEDLPGHQGEVFALDWSADGGKVGSGGADKAVKLWSH